MRSWRAYDGGTIDAAAVLLRETNRQLNLLPRLPACFEGRRQPWLISYTVQVMAAQRAYAPAVGYEDLSDHDQLREGPAIRYREEAIDEVLTNQRQSLAQPKSRSPESVCEERAILWTGTRQGEPTRSSTLSDFAVQG